jgi:arylsulfatase
MIANLDENMGRLLTTLDETGLADNTILVFFNDNGGTAGVNLYNAGMRGRKTMYYEGGHRAACFIRWPGQIAPQAVDTLAEVQDLLPTLIDLCGIDKPADAKFDGQSLKPLLTRKNEPQALAERMLVVQYGQVPAKFDSAVLWHKWRLVHGTELYDLASDPGQKQDVAAAHADVVAKMRNHYEQWWSEVSPLLDQPVPIVIGAEEENPVTLSAADWWNVYCDNMRNLREGKEANSKWNLVVAADGKYEIALRRWPKEADAPIAAGVPAFEAVDGQVPAGRALPIAAIRLKVGDALDETKPVPAGAKEVKFTVALKKGTKLDMQSYCYDGSGKELCGAYFAYVTRK